MTFRASSMTPREDAVVVEGGTHPEATCQECGRPNPVWFAPNDLWNAVRPEGGIVCPSCFAAQAEAQGRVPTGWSFAPERTVSSDFTDAERQLHWRAYKTAARIAYATQTGDRAKAIEELDALIALTEEKP